MMNKFSPFYILDAFFKLFPEDKNKIIFIPLIIAFIISFFVNININLVNILIASLSIFMGFLLNLMLLSVNFKDNDKPPIEVGGKLWFLTDFLEEYNITISLELLITIILIIILIFSSLTYKSIQIYSPEYILNCLRFIFNWSVTYLTLIFFIFIFRVLKISYRLMNYYIKN